MANPRDYYKGNPHLPKALTRKEFTPEQQEELFKCMIDPVYFAEKYFKIVHVDKGLIPFTLYDYQKKAIRTMQDHRYMLMCASRQCGKTSVATVIVLHAALFNDEKKIGLLANKAPTAREILKRIKRAYEYLPDWLKGGVKEWNKSSVEFENGSVILADATTGDSIRGHSLFMLYIDEMAFIENWNEFAQAVLPTLSSGETTKIVFTSTPKGLNHFYDYYNGAKEKTNGYQLIEVPWWEVPGRDEKWRVRAMEELNNDEEKFAQEYALEFMGSSGTLINGATLKHLATIKVRPYHEDQGLKMYVEPHDGHQYVMTCDVSRGKGLDYSAFHVIDVSTRPYKQVCTYRNNMITPTDYAAIINRVGRHYNYAYVLVEINDLGGQVSDLLYMSYEYENLMMTESRGRNGKQISAGFTKNPDRGLRTTKTTKGNGCAMIKLIIEQRKLEIVDVETINELKTFSAKGDSYEAEEGKHDDLAMGLVIFGWMSDQSYFKLLTDKNVLEEIRDQTEEEMEDFLVPFGIFVNKVDMWEVVTEVEVTVESDDAFDRWLQS